MAKVSIVDCSVKNNPSPFQSDFHFEITFDSFENLSDGECLSELCFFLTLPSFFLRFGMEDDICWLCREL